MKLGYFGKLHKLVYLAGALEPFNRKEGVTEDCLRQLINLPKLSFVQVESRSTWIKIIRDIDGNFIGDEDVEYNLRDDIFWTGTLQKYPFRAKHGSS